jgi:hypothetical protein
MTRFTLLPDPRFAALGAHLAERINDAANALTPDNFPDVLDPLMRRILVDAFTTAATELRKSSQLNREQGEARRHVTALAPRAISRERAV